MVRQTGKKIVDRLKRDRNKRLRETALKQSYDYQTMKRHLKERRDIARNRMKLKNEPFKDKQTKQATLDS